jgi:hypothetical protein
MKNKSLSSSDDNLDEFSPKNLLQILQPGQWLNLEDLPSPVAHNQALIICQVSSHHWLTWIPDYGEYCLIL